MISVKLLGQPLVRPKRTSGPDGRISAWALKELEKILGRLPKYLSIK